MSVVNDSRKEAVALAMASGSSVANCMHDRRASDRSATG